MATVLALDHSQLLLLDGLTHDFIECLTREAHSDALPVIVRQGAECLEWIAGSRIPSRAVTDLGELATALADGDGVDVVASGGCRVRGSLRDLTTMLRPLLSRAQAVAAREHPVVITVTRRGADVTLAVRHQVKAVFDDLLVAFRDPDDLDLALARAIAVAHMGSLTAEPAADGGLYPTLTLPGIDVRR
jgi:hypothetical protein